MEGKVLKKKGNIRVRPMQFELIVAAMRKNPFLNGAKLTATYTCSKRQEDWKKLCAELNSRGGAVKSLKAWQKTWVDKKVEVKKRYRHFKDSLKKTGGKDEIFLTPLEKKIVALMALDSCESLSTVESEGLREVHEAQKNKSPGDSNSEGRNLTIPSLPQETNEYVQPHILDDLSCADLPDAEEACMASTPAAQTPLAPTPQTDQDARLRSLQRRVRIKPLLIRNDNAEKFIASQKEIALSIDKLAEAEKKKSESLQRRNLLQEEELELQKRKLDMLEVFLEIYKKNSRK